jgi:hypothetical protein
MYFRCHLNCKYTNPQPDIANNTVDASSFGSVLFSIIGRQRFFHLKHKQRLFSEINKRF